jgi:hypothetical protein
VGFSTEFHSFRPNLEHTSNDLSKGLLWETSCSVRKTTLGDNRVYRALMVTKMTKVCHITPVGPTDISNPDFRIMINSRTLLYKPTTLPLLQAQFTLPHAHLFVNLTVKIFSLDCTCTRVYYKGGYHGGR